MKNITLLIALLFAFITNAQHAGKKPALLIGKTVTVLNKPFTDMGFSGFYTSNTSTYDNTYDPVVPHGSYTKTEALAGKKFKVTGLEKVKLYNDEADFLKLEGDNGLILYYRYDPDFAQDFPFKVAGGLNVPKGFYCTYITKEGTGFATEITDGITFYKQTKNNVAKYTITINQPGDDYKEGKGATLFLSNNKKIQKATATVKIDANSYGGYFYTATFELTAADIALLKTNTIINTKVLTYSSDVTEGEKLKGIFNCLITKK